MDKIGWIADFAIHIHPWMDKIGWIASYPFLSNPTWNRWTSLDKVINNFWFQFQKHTVFN